MSSRSTACSSHTAYCAVVANSTGMGAHLLASGASAALGNDFSLCALDLPMDSFGMFIASASADFVANPGGSTGNLCIGPVLGRGVGGEIYNSGMAGSFAATADLAAVPTGNGTSAVMAGDTLYFQAWFRDSVGGMATSNFSNGLDVSFN